MSSPSTLDVGGLTVTELLAGYSMILDELRQREIVCSSNNPLGDYAELLFCKAFGWTQERNSASGHDATDSAGVRYQIKGRRLTPHRVSRRVSAFRRLDKQPFDHLAGLIVDERFQILRAAIVPFAVVRAKANYVDHTHSWRFFLRDDVWVEPDVRDVTQELRAAAAAI